MASHERWQITLEATPARKRILRELRRRHFRGVAINDDDIAAFMAELAFTVPQSLSRSVEALVRYREAEGFAGGEPLDQLTGTVSNSWRKLKL